MGVWREVANLSLAILIPSLATRFEALAKSQWLELTVQAQSSISAAATAPPPLLLYLKTTWSWMFVGLMSLIHSCV
jgi:hypothetical protein